jgi:hypothetical protein
MESISFQNREPMESMSVRCFFKKNEFIRPNTVLRQRGDARLFRVEAFFVVIVSLSLLAGCRESDNSHPKSAQNGSAAAPAEKFTPANLFPAGPGRDMVVSSCGSCHSLLCVVRGQRTAQRWDTIKQSHRDKLTSVSGSDLDTMFVYLKEHFNDTKPEPTIPAEFLQEGCTPY